VFQTEIGNAKNGYNHFELIVVTIFHEIGVTPSVAPFVRTITVSVVNVPAY
jgi:hypothetical protein